MFRFFSQLSFFLVTFFVTSFVAVAGTPTTIKGTHNTQSVRYELLEQLTPNLGHYRYSFENGPAVGTCDAYVTVENGAETKKIKWDIVRCYVNNKSMGKNYICSASGEINQGNAEGSYLCNSGRTGVFHYTGF